MSINGKTDGDGEHVADAHHYEHPSEVPGYLKKCVLPSPSQVKLSIKLVLIKRQVLVSAP